MLGARAPWDGGSRWGHTAGTAHHTPVGPSGSPSAAQSRAKRQRKMQQGGSQTGGKICLEIKTCRRCSFSCKPDHLQHTTAMGEESRWNREAFLLPPPRCKQLTPLASEGTQRQPYPTPSSCLQMWSKLCHASPQLYKFFPLQVTHRIMTPVTTLGPNSHVLILLQRSSPPQTLVVQPGWANTRLRPGQAVLHHTTEPIVQLDGASTKLRAPSGWLMQ